MEGKNLILAISLSAFVLIMWSIFFAPPPPTIDKEQNKIEKTQKKDDEISSPSIDTKKETTVLTRAKSLKSSKRISIKNENISGVVTANLFNFLGSGLKLARDHSSANGVRLIKFD